jgi:hypothetical protein
MSQQGETSGARVFGALRCEFFFFFFSSLESESFFLRFFGGEKRRFSTGFDFRREARVCGRRCPFGLEIRLHGFHFGIFLGVGGGGARRRTMSCEWARVGARSGAGVVSFSLLSEFPFWVFFWGEEEGGGVGVGVGGGGGVAAQEAASRWRRSARR